MLWLIYLLLAVTPFEQSVVSGINGPRMMRDLGHITQFDRISGGEGEAKAIDYLVEQLKADGIPVHVYEFDSLLSWPGAASIEITAPQNRKIEALTFAFGKSTPAAGLTGDLVEARLTGADFGLAGDVRVDPAGLKGKIAWVNARAFPHVARQVEEAGALGAVFTAAGDRLTEGIGTIVWGTPSTANERMIPASVGVTIKKADGEFIKSLLAKGPVKARLRTTVDTQWRKLRLPVAMIGGRVTNQFILVGSHIDAWHRGGTDAGASNIIGLELARSLHRNRADLQRSVWIAWWPGHSTGRYSGSAWFADSQFRDLERGAVVHINMDGLGSKGGELGGAQNTSEFDGFAGTILQEAAGASARVARPNRNSDQSFLGIGVPSLQFDNSVPASLGGYWWWHTTEDTFDKAGEKEMVRDAVAVALAVSRIANSNVIPYNFADLAGQIVNRTEEYQKQAGNRLDLSEALDVALNFKAVCAMLSRYLESDIPQMRLRNLNDQMIRVTRNLNPVLYTVNGRFHPDDANPKTILPGLTGVADLGKLSGNDLRFAQAYLIREKNRLIEALDRAVGIVEALVR